MKLFLRLERDGMILGEWPLEDLKITLTDGGTGAPVADLTVQTHGTDEVPVPGLQEARSTGPEDLTLTHGHPSPLPVLPASAEVWSKGRDGWKQKGVLRAGQRARMGSAFVQLDENGDLLVSSGPDLSGTATLPSGLRQPVESGADRLRLPSGSSVTLESETRAFYVRSDFVERPLVEHSSAEADRGQGIQALASDLNES
jgi:hypothetical protein